MVSRPSTPWPERRAQMGFGGPGCWAGADAGRSESGLRARPDRIGFVFLIFFRNQFSMRKQFQKNLVIVLKHQKYSENSKNFRKNPRDTLGHEQSK
jgi:hypothetical protein